MNTKEIESIVADNLRVSEGLRLKLYKDTVGKLTIGYGHNIEDRGISRKIAEMLLQEDMDFAYIDLMMKLSWVANCPDKVLIVLWDMCYNMGIGNSKKGLLSFKNTLRLIQEGNYLSASQNMLKSRWARQVGNRAVRLSEILKSI